MRKAILLLAALLIVAFILTPPVNAQQQTSTCDTNGQYTSLIIAGLSTPSTLVTFPATMLIHLENMAVVVVDGCPVVVKALNNWPIYIDVDGPVQVTGIVRGWSDVAYEGIVGTLPFIDNATIIHAPDAAATPAPTADALYPYSDGVGQQRPILFI